MIGRVRLRARRTFTPRSPGSRGGSHRTCFTHQSTVNNRRRQRREGPYTGHQQPLTNNPKEILLLNFCYKTHDFMRDRTGCGPTRGNLAFGGAIALYIAPKAISLNVNLHKTEDCVLCERFVYHQVIITPSSLIVPTLFHKQWVLNLKSKNSKLLIIKRYRKTINNMSYFYVCLSTP